MAKTMAVEKTIKEQKDFCNITEWHDNGITGKNIHVWNCEDLSDHGKTSKRRILDSAPDAIVYNAGISASRSSDKINYVYVEDSHGKHWEPEDWIREHNIKVASRSKEKAFAGADTGEWFDLWNGLKKKYNLVIFDSAGNKADEEKNRYEGYDIAVTVGAVNLVKGKVKPASYTSVTDDVDFADFTGVWSGTSFSCPYLAGKAALLLERYGDMSQTEIFKYFKMCAQDVYEECEDNKTGWGVVVLPKFEKKYITMTTKSTLYYINGEPYKMDTKPVNKSGNVFVPVRFIAEALGAEVNWEKNADKTIKVLIDKEGTHIELNTEDYVALVNGEKKYLNLPSFIDGNNRTLVPIRFIAEGLNCSVDWVQQDAKVMILEK